MTTLPDTTHLSTATIDAYLAGGLDAAERRAADAHAGECAACLAALSAAGRADRRLADAFAAVRPPADYEDQLVATLRPKLRHKGLWRSGPPAAGGAGGGGAGTGGGTWPRLAGPARWAKRLNPQAVHPAVRRIATAAAAAVVLGAVGYGMQQAEDAKRAAEAGRGTEARYEGVVASADGLPPNVVRSKMLSEFQEAADRGEVATVGGVAGATGNRAQEEETASQSSTAAGQAGGKPAAAPNRPTIVVGKEVEKRQFPLLNTRGADASGPRPSAADGEAAAAGAGGGPSAVRFKSSAGSDDGSGTDPSRRGWDADGLVAGGQPATPAADNYYHYFDSVGPAGAGHSAWGLDVRRKTSEADEPAKAAVLSTAAPAVKGASAGAGGSAGAAGASDRGRGGVATGLGLDAKKADGDRKSLADGRSAGEGKPVAGAAIAPWGEVNAPANLSALGRDADGDGIADSDFIGGVRFGGGGGSGGRGGFGSGGAGGKDGGAVTRGPSENRLAAEGKEGAQSKSDKNAAGRAERSFDVTLGAGAAHGVTLNGGGAAGGAPPAGYGVALDDAVVNRGTSPDGSKRSPGGQSFAFGQTPANGPVGGPALGLPVSGPQGAGSAPQGVSAAAGTVSLGYKEGLLEAPKVEAKQMFRPTDLFAQVAAGDDAIKLPQQPGKPQPGGGGGGASDELDKRLVGGMEKGEKELGEKLAEAAKSGEPGAVDAVKQVADREAKADSAGKPGSAAADEKPAGRPADGPKPGEPAKPSEGPPPAPPAASEKPQSTTPPPVPPTARASQANPVVQQAAPPAAVEAPKPIQRKIIRHGNLQFEVDSFDSALRQVTSIVAEEAGFIATTDSEKLPNGRVRGSVTLRCPPERLDVLVLKLRGLGELKSQKISADDVTKQYTDLEAQLTAGRAMYERLLAIIKAGGAVKDLLEAEKQLGVWREKLERLEGERRYLENLVSMSTLEVELAERDVRAPTSADERESVTTSVETEDVEQARADAIKAVEVAKGRVVDSNLTKHEGGQLSATIVADVQPDAAGPVIDRLKQLGKVARLDISRKTTTQGGVGPIIPGLRVERRETRFQISIYNLAKVAPRQSATLTVAAADVEATYKAILEQTRGLGATIVASQLSRPRADQMVATVRFEVPTEKADAASALVRAGVDVMQMQTSVSEDRDNTTDAKRGFSVEVKSLAHVPPRETTTLQLAAPSVPASFAKLLEAARGGGGRVITSQLNEQDPTNVTGTLEFEVTRDKWQPVADALAAAGVVVTRNLARSPDTETTVDSKVRLSVSVFDDVRLAPRETVVAQVASATVADTFAALTSAAREDGAKAVGSNLNLADRTNPNGTLSFAVPRENASKVEAALKAAGVMVSRTVNRLADGPMNVETKVGFDIRVFDEVQLVPRELVAATVATRQVPEAYNALAEAARSAGARAVGSNLDQADKANPVGRVVFAVPKESADKFEAALKAAGLQVARTVNRQQDGPLVVDTKAGFDVRVVDERTLVPRESQAMRVVTRNVTDRYAKVLDVLRLVDAQVTQSRVVQENRNSTVGVLEFVVRRADQPAVEKALSDGADVFDKTVARSQDVQGTVDHLVRYSVELRDADQQRPRQTYDLSAEAADPDKAAADLEAAAVGAGGRRADLRRTLADGRATAVLVLDVPLARAVDLVAAVRQAGTVTALLTSRDDAVPEGSLSRARLTVTLTPPGSVRAERTLGDTVREGLSTSLTGLLASLRYVIVGLCLVLPWLIVVWVAYRLVRRSRRPEATPAVSATPPTVPPAAGPPAGPAATPA